jgi:dolichyl-phosphate beta-glucosyltransferase
LDFTYSIVLPAYNEGERIGATLKSVLAFAAQQNWNVEVIVVNDGSTDDTASVVLEHALHNPMLRLVNNPGNRGKGYSVRNGMLHAQGKILLFSDADLSSPIQEAPKLFAAIKNGADVAIGSRWLRPELQITRQPLRRQIFGRIFNLALRLVLGLHFKDTQCGFKAFSRHAVEVLFPLQKIERWGFDPEILFLAKMAGFEIAEVPVRWAHREGGGIHPLRDGIRMVGEMMKIRWNSLTGKYTARHVELKSPVGIK